jgi:hypothetical protein
MKQIFRILKVTEYFGMDPRSGSIPKCHVSGTLLTSIPSLEEECDTIRRIWKDGVDRLKIEWDKRHKKPMPYFGPAVILLLQIYMLV